MNLKNYQSRVLGELGGFLDVLAQKRSDFDDIVAKTPESARAKVADNWNFVKEACDETNKPNPPDFKNGLGEWLPDVYLKVPTGGGKTLLACHTIEQIQRQYLRRGGGLVLWIVPTTQIYRQTLEKLADRAHPYRQILDIASGGRTLIRERGKPLKPADLNGNLVILMLMLPAANRQSKETLRMFKDSGGYDSFFPDSDEYDLHAELLSQTPNLDVFEGTGGVFPPVIKTSLGNVIKYARPLMVVDEGQRAYSKNARETLYGFNPAFMLELSATPPQGVCIVSAASGSDLDREEMIKLDIHLSNTATGNWKDTVMATINKRVALEKAADEYRQNGNSYIRPIALIQAERTGADQRGRNFVHAEDVREFLVQQSGIQPEHVAVKSSDKDDIEGMDLLSDESSVRYIITRSALQEGWDCAFAYVLAVLTNPTSPVAMTQLVGRILRQPEARKTKIRALDECYVYTRHKTADEIIGAIKTELEKEGLEDLSGRITPDGGDNNDENMPDTSKKEKTQTRLEFEKSTKRIYLPQFVAIDGDKVRLMDYYADILGNINWDKIRPLDGMDKIALGPNTANRDVRIGLRGKLRKEEEPAETEEGIGIDQVFMTRQLVDSVPNAWRAYDMSGEILQFFLKKYGEQKTAENFIHIVEESRRLLAEQRDKLAEEVFARLIKQGHLRFVLLTGKGVWRVPSKSTINSLPYLTRKSGEQLKKSLHEKVAASDYNGLEKNVALYLDEQEKLLWWYRNRARADYHIQGWRKDRIFPDFIAKSDKIVVLELKGEHLMNEDTAYKESVFGVCNKLCESLSAYDLDKHKTGWQELGAKFENGKFLFRVVREKEWRSAINEIFA